ncbi:hypothetical protein P7K49_014304, partial [Saguinus oedipus]
EQEEQRTACMHGKSPGTLTQARAALRTSQFQQQQDFFDVVTVNPTDPMPRILQWLPQYSRLVTFPLL